MTQPIYTAFSFYSFLRSLIYRLLALTGLIVSLTHYEENPVVISIFAGLCLLFILFIADDRISVYPDKVVQSSNSIVSLLMVSRSTQFLIRDISSASLQPPGDPVKSAAVAVVLYLLPGRSRRHHSSPIFLELKNGEMASLETELGKRQMQKIADLINKLVHQYDSHGS